MLLNLLSGSVFHLKPGANSVGRQAGNDMVLSDASVSGRHCEIIVTGETLRLRDLHSTNGTFINGRRVKESPLAGGQTIRIGSVELAVLPVPDSQDSEESATQPAEFSVIDVPHSGSRPVSLAKLWPPA
ncbi:MAG: FHA domain-containing protein, partial [Verrucomicrobiaceae bacterium]